MTSRTVLSDEAWAWLEPLLPDRTPRRGGRWRDHRQVIEAIAWKYRTGSPWREVPDRFGPWQTVYERHQRWSADGTWARLLTAAQADADARGELDWLVAADSSLMRVHQHGASARRFGGNAATAPGPARAVPGVAAAGRGVAAAGRGVAAAGRGVTGGGVELQEIPG